MASHAFSSAFSSAFNIEVATGNSGGSAMMWSPINREMNRNLPVELILEMRRNPGKASMLMMKFMKDNVENNTK